MFSRTYIVKMYQRRCHLTLLCLDHDFWIACTSYYPFSFIVSGRQLYQLLYIILIVTYVKIFHRAIQYINAIEMELFCNMLIWKQLDAEQKTSVYALTLLSKQHSSFEISII